MYPLSSCTLYGSWATLLLGTSSSGEIDWIKMSDEIDTLIASRPDGIYSNGTAGEFYSQSTEEFIRVSELLSLKCERSGIPFQIGVSHPCAQESLERLRLIRSLRPGAVQVILPDWFPVNDEEAARFLDVMAEEANGIPLVLYNPPHAKRVLEPEKWKMLKERVPSLIGVKVFDRNCDPLWYADMNLNNEGISVFVPGHHLATGVLNGAKGAYSNVACLNPFAAKKWYDSMSEDMSGAIELESRICGFMSECIDPFIVRNHLPNHACDRFMALVGGWADVGPSLRWPYSSVPVTEVDRVRTRGRDIIPEFFTD